MANTAQTVDLLRAVISPPDKRRDVEITRLAAAITRWDEVIASAKQHRVAPLLYTALRRTEATVPADPLEVLRREFDRNAFQCFANSSELIGVLKEFEQGGIAAMPFKGVALGASLYGDMTERSSGDLDLLIQHGDLNAAAQILRYRGYLLRKGWLEQKQFFEYPFDRSADGMILELRWRLELTQPRFRKVLGLDWVWPRREMVMVAGKKVPCPDAVSNLLVLCMHGTKHVWSRLMWVGDVARLLGSQPRLDWTSVEKQAREVGLWRAVGLGVVLAHRIGSAPVPADVLGRFERDRSVRRLAEFLAVHIFEKPGARPPGRMPYSIQILDPRDRAAVVFSPSFLRPTPQDCAVVKLPKSLEALYYVIRPIRILLDRSARG